MIPTLLILSLAAGQDMALNQILIPGQGWLGIVGVPGSPGVLGVDSAGHLVFADAEQPLLYRLDARNQPVLLAKLGGVAAGLAPAQQGGVVVSVPRQRRILRIDDSGKEEILHTGVLAGALVQTTPDTVFYLGPRRAIYRVNREDRLLRQLDEPAGLALWADKATLVVGDSIGPHLTAFRINQWDNLDAQERYYTLRARPGEMSGVQALSLDGAGRLYAASRIGVQIFDPTGRLCGVLNSPVRAPVTALTLAGKRCDQLYIICGGKLYTRKIQVGKP
jgi:gluconolactonase